MTGLLLGSAAAFCLALAYVFSSLAVRRHLDISPIGLLCRAHLIMGALSLAGLCFTWSPWSQPFAAARRPVFGGVFLSVGTDLLFLAQRKVDSSRCCCRTG